MALTGLIINIMEKKVATRIIRSIYGLSLVTIILGIFVFGKVDYHPAISVTNVTWSLNTAYQPSTTRDAHITCGSSISANLTLSGGQTGTILVQTSPDNITYTTVGTMSCGSTGTVVVGLNTNNTQSSSITIAVPRTGYFKLVSSGSATISALSGQQELFN